MTDPQIPSDRAEKKREEVRDSGFTTEQDEEVKDKQKEQFEKERKVEPIPSTEESLEEKIEKKKKTDKKWWQFWRS